MVGRENLRNFNLDKACDVSHSGVDQSINLPRRADTPEIQSRVSCRHSRSLLSTHSFEQQLPSLLPLPLLLQLTLQPVLFKHVLPLPQTNPNPLALPPRQRPPKRQRPEIPARPPRHPKTNGNPRSQHQSAHTHPTRDNHTVPRGRIYRE